MMKTAVQTQELNTVEIEVQAQVYTHVYNPVGSASHEAKACHTIQKKDLDKKKNTTM